MAWMVTCVMPDVQEWVEQILSHTPVAYAVGTYDIRGLGASPACFRSWYDEVGPPDDLEQLCPCDGIGACGIISSPFLGARKVG